jgi:hypothetical protein
MISVYRISSTGASWYLFKTKDIEKAIKRAFEYIDKESLSGGFEFRFDKDSWIMVKDRADFIEFRKTLFDFM